MNREDIYNLMDNPALMTQDTLPLVKEVVDMYPWFATGRILYLKNLSNTGSGKFEEELGKNAFYVTDRKKLYNYIHYEVTEEAVEVAPEVEQDPDDPFMLIDSFLTAQGTMASFSPTDPLAIQPSVSNDYLLWAYSHKEEDQKEREDVLLKHQDLIDSFLTEEENREPGARMLRMEENETAKAPSLIVDDEEYEKTLDDSYFTETLARIYVKQQRYDKAMQIIQKLSLKYPEKNIYFADQIRFLEKLIINNTKK